MGFGKLLLKAMDVAMSYEAPSSGQQQHHHPAASGTPLRRMDKYQQQIYSAWQRDPYANRDLNYYLRSINWKDFERWGTVWSRDAFCCTDLPTYLHACRSLWSSTAEQALPLWQQDMNPNMDFPSYANRLYQLGWDRVQRAVPKWRSSNKEQLSLPDFVRRRG